MYKYIIAFLLGFGLASDISSFIGTVDGVSRIYFLMSIAEHFSKARKSRKKRF